MGFYRIVKKTIKFVLYQMPKKWLIMIIFSLLMVFGLTQVKALDINSPNYVQFTYTNSWGNTSTYKITCDSPCIIRPDDNNNSYFSCYSASDNATKINVAYYVNGSEYYNGGGSQFLGSMTSSSMSGFTGGGDIALYSKENTLMYSHTNTINPSITTTTTIVRNYTFATLDIDGGNVVNSSNLVGSYLNYNYMGSDYRLDIDNYISVSPTGYCTWSIPRAELLQDMAIASGRVLTFELEVIVVVEGGRDFRYYSLGSYTLNPSTAQANAVNQDQNLANLENINSSINETNETITNDNIEGSSVVQQPDVPQDTSGVESGVNNIFSAIMNVFTNLDTTQNVVLPIPFTNKSITIPR